MKDLYLLKDLINLFQQDKHFGVHKNLVTALKKFGVSGYERSNEIDQMYNALAVQVISQYGESEPFLAEAFIYPEGIVQALKQQRLPTPLALQAVTTENKEALLSDPEQVEHFFEIICRNCGTVNDPLGKNFQTPIGRLIFKTYIETRKALGISTTAKYVFEHLGEYDREKVITSVLDDAVTWRTEDGKEKITSVDTIGRYIIKFEREVKALRLFE